MSLQRDTSTINTPADNDFAFGVAAFGGVAVNAPSPDLAPMSFESTSSGCTKHWMECPIAPTGS
jgi:hypothetical protein